MLIESGYGSRVLAVSQSGRADLRYTIPGHVRTLLASHKALHLTAKNKTIQISIGLNLRHAGELQTLLAAQNNPNSPQYHHYITPAEFTYRFGADQQQVNSVQAYLRSQGLSISTISPSHIFVDAAGSVKSVEQAFHIALADYAIGGQLFYAPLNEPSVPAALAGTVASIDGLDNVAQYRPHYLSAVGGKLRSHSGGAKGGYTPDQLRTAYDIAPLTSNGYTGSGQVMAILEMDGYQVSDIDKYFAYYNLGTPHYSNVLVDGVSNKLGADAVEDDLDMEVAAAIAPGATQMIYITLNTSVGVIDGYSRIVSDNLAKVVSTSWGLCEDQVGNREISILNTIFEQAAAQGQAVFAATGDNGAYGCGDTELAVESPADNPYVVGVGGTTLHLGANGSYGSESAWSCPRCIVLGPLGSGSGGGISAVFPRPAYRTGPGHFYDNRTVPDVSANADPFSGYSIYCTVLIAGCSKSGWRVIGGTSAATPLWAGIAVDINQYLGAQGKPGLGGNANIALYRLFNTPQPFAAYHDIVAGNNLVYPAGPGYDLATGIGTPDAWNIARDLASTSN